VGEARPPIRSARGWNLLGGGWRKSGAGRVAHRGSSAGRASSNWRCAEGQSAARSEGLPEALATERNRFAPRGLPHRERLDRAHRRARAREPRSERARSGSGGHGDGAFEARAGAARAHHEIRIVGENMGIFARLARLIKSNLNDLISRAEDPEKMLNQI